MICRSDWKRSNHHLFRSMRLQEEWPLFVSLNETTRRVTIICLAKTTSQKRSDHHLFLSLRPQEEWPLFVSLNETTSQQMSDHICLAKWNQNTKAEWPLFVSLKETTRGVTIIWFYETTSQMKKVHDICKLRTFGISPFSLYMHYS